MLSGSRQVTVTHVAQPGRCAACEFQWDMVAVEQTAGTSGQRTPIEQLLRALQSRRIVEIDHRDDYVMVRARSTGAVSLYAHVDRVAICVPPGRGYALEDQTPFRHQIPQTRLSTYVIVSARELPEHFERTVDLAVESLDWRESGEATGVCMHCGVGCGRRLDACPNCWTEVQEGGTCLCHEDTAHAVRAG